MSSQTKIKAIEERIKNRDCTYCKKLILKPEEAVFDNKNVFCNHLHKQLYANQDLRIRPDSWEKT